MLKLGVGIQIRVWCGAGKIIGNENKDLGTDSCCVNYNLILARVFVVCKESGCDVRMAGCVCLKLQLKIIINL